MINEYKEYEEIIEAMLKASGNFDVFNVFEDKISKRNVPPSQIQQNVIVLTSLAEAVEDKDLKLELYEKIIQELVLQVFKV